MCLKRPAPMGSPRRLCANGWAASWLRARRAWPMRPRARRSPRAIAPAKALAIVELRRKRLTQARIAQALGVSASTVSRVLARRLSPWPPGAEPGAHEHQAPAICCTSTSRSWDVSSALAPGHGQPTRYR
ncbi:DNA-binding helix-turn-helix protein [Bordetella pertussis H939]|nr:DNA-binding helix-turn-helix protein [Bordetella pertussis H939]ETH43357.1 DNA-binding helix-turn-helix protein [Bordetella pertussis H939]